MYQSDEVWHQIQLSLLFSKITPMSIQNKDLNNVCLKQKRKEKENEVIDANIDQKLE